MDTQRKSVTAVDNGMVVALRAHLQATARRAPPFVYLYVSSHGRETLLPPGPTADGGMLSHEVALLDQPVIQLGGRDGRGSTTASVMLDLRRGRDPDTLLFYRPATAAASSPTHDPRARPTPSPPCRP